MLVPCQASIQDRRLLVNLEKNPGVYLRQASIQIRLVFKEIRYVEWLTTEMCDTRVHMYSVLFVAVEYSLGISLA